MKGPPFRYPCPQCAGLFKLTACEKHVKTCVSGNTYTCSVCGKDDIPKARYKSHAVRCRKVNPAGYGKGCRESSQTGAGEAGAARSTGAKGDSEIKKEEKNSAAKDASAATGSKKKKSTKKNTAGKRISDDQLLVIAARQRLPTDLYKCSDCSVVLGTQAMANQHILPGICSVPNNGVGVKELRTVSSKGKNFVCPKCSQFFVYAQPAVSHIANCDPEVLRHCIWPKTVKRVLPSDVREVKGKKGERREAKAIYSIGEMFSRAQLAVSEDGQEAVVKEVACHLRCPIDAGISGNGCKGGKTMYLECCQLAVDPAVPYQYRCTNPKCRQTLLISQDNRNHMTEYLWARRQTKKILGLLSISAPLDASSFYNLGAKAKSCGIISNTTHTHLTFVEGLRLPNGNSLDSTESYAEWLARTLYTIKELQAALFADPAVSIDALRTIPRSIDKKTVLVVADVSLSSSKANEASDMLRSNSHCAFPQFPFHVAIGACSRQDATTILPIASSRLEGLELKVDPSRMSALAPSLDQKLPEMMGPMHSDAKVVAATAAKQQNDAEAFGNVISFRNGSST